MKFNKRNTGLFLCGIFLIIVLRLFGMYTMKTPDTRKLKTQVILTTDEIVDKMKTPERDKLDGFIDSAVEITGQIKEITFRHEKYSLILTGENQEFLVLCEMQPNELKKIKKLKAQDTVVVKGVLKGFLKDAILLNCIILEKDTYE